MPAVNTQLLIPRERSGLQIVFKETKEYNIPTEFELKLNENQALKDAFENLTPGRQRAYIFHLSQPKKAETRESRIEKTISKILKGKALHG